MKLQAPNGNIINVHPSKVDSMINKGWKNPDDEKKAKPKKDKPEVKEDELKESE
jgi:hypothetical protein